jgi:hypothetical protein
MPSAYPRLLKLSPAVLDSLKIYLDSELTNHKAERGAFTDDLIAMQRDYWAKPRGGKRTFPFAGAADIIIPLTAIAFEAVHARSMTTLFGNKHKLSCAPKSPQWTDHAPKFQSFLEDELESMKFKKMIEPSIMEIEKFGTGLGRAGYCKTIKYGMREIGGVEQEFPVVVKRGPTVDSVPLSRFIMSFAAHDPQTAAWCGEELSWTESELLAHEQGGLFFEGIHEKLKSFYVQANSALTSEGNKFEASQAELEKRTPVFPSRIDFVELWLGFNIDDDPDGKLVEIVVHYHPESREVMSCRFNWHADLRRPHRIGVYIPIEHRWTGIGICKQNEQFQKEITTQHRQRLDNATLANMRMLKVSRLSGYGPKEPVFPGKLWFLDDMTHIESLQMAEVYPSAYNNENQSLIYSQQRTAVNESTLGMPQQGTPGTATGDLQRLQEGRKKFDYSFANIKAYNNELITDIACNIQQFGSRRVEFFEQIDGAGLVKQILDMPEETIREGLLLEIKLAGEQENKVVDRQNWTQVAGMLTQYYTQMSLLAQTLGDVQLQRRIAEKGLAAATEAMKQIAESFDLKNIDRIVMMELIQNASSGPKPVPTVAGSGSVGPNSPGGAVADTAPTIPAVAGSSY